MLKQETINKMNEMNLTTMAKAFKTQSNDLNRMTLSYPRLALRTESECWLTPSGPKGKTIV
jgi:hypothetical protein